MNELIRTLFAVVMLSICQVMATSCATMNRSGPAENPVPTSGAAAAPAATPSAESTESKGGSKDAGTQKQKLFQYVVTLSDPSQPFTDADREFLASLQPAPEPGSLREAAIVVGTLRACLEDTANIQSFKEKDLTAAEPQPPHTTPSASSDLAKSPATTKQMPAVSLEGRLADKSVHLTQSLQRNMLLRSHRVFYLAQKVVALTENSAPFAKELNEMIVEEATQWAQLIPKAPLVQPLPIGVLSPTQPGAPTGGGGLTPPADSSTKNDLNKGLAPLVLSPAASSQPDSTLASAQQLADNGQFKQAVDQARKVGTGDPAYPEAKTKIKTFSNQAVQTLRQKAAQAFQNAMPASDASVKSAYLEQARVYLQQALTDFPDADSLDTVKENLTVISKDIERLETQKSAAKKSKSGGKVHDEDETVIKD